MLKPPKINPIIKIKEEVALLNNSANYDTQLINSNSVNSHKVTNEITENTINEHDNSISDTYEMESHKCQYCKEILPNKFLLRQHYIQNHLKLLDKLRKLSIVYVLCVFQH